MFKIINLGFDNSVIWSEMFAFHLVLKILTELNVGQWYLKDLDVIFL